MTIISRKYREVWNVIEQEPKLEEMLRFILHRDAWGADKVEALD